VVDVHPDEGTNKVIFICEGDPEVAKRSGRKEPMWVVIYKCIEAMLGISLYSYLYPN
jgi:hypothetical protein